MESLFLTTGLLTLELIKLLLLFLRLRALSEGILDMELASVLVPPLIVFFSTWVFGLSGPGEFLVVRLPAPPLIVLTAKVLDLSVNSFGL